jgi:quercetin dioxygenase-like cupin family protein
MSRSRRLRAMVILALLACLFITPVAGDAQQVTGVPVPTRVTQTNGVTREVLGDGTPLAAPGQTLSLVRYTFAPGAVIAPHTHPGEQAATVVSGTLGYTVLCGHADVVRASVDGAPQVRERLNAGPEVIFQPGDSFTEIEGIVHFGRNAGSGPLVLLVASLFASDAAVSSPAAPLPNIAQGLNGQTSYC